jgi:hypothetical protein
LAEGEDKIVFEHAVFLRIQKNSIQKSTCFFTS